MPTPDWQPEVRPYPLARVHEAYPGQWRALCEAADQYVADFLCRAMQEWEDRTARGEWAGDIDVWMSDAVHQLTVGHRSRHAGSNRPGLIQEWWQDHVGDQWRVAYRLWREEVAHM